MGKQVQEYFKFQSLLFGVRAVWVPFRIILVLLFLGGSVWAADVSLQLDIADRAWLNGHPSIRLAPDPEFAPIELFDRNGRYQGVAADMIQLLEKKLGFSFTIVKCRNWDEVMEKFRNHEVDALGAIVSTPHRRTFMRISEPLLKVPGAIMVRNIVDTSLSFADLTGLKVAVVSNYTAHDIMTRAYPDILLEVVPNTTTGLSMVSFGTVDAFVENLATATYYLQESAISNVRPAGDTPFNYQWGIGIRADWPELEKIINQGIASISQTERQQILNRWIPVRKPWQLNRMQILAILVAFALFGVGAILLWSLSLRRTVLKRTTALNHKIEDHQQAEEEIRLLNVNLEQRVKERTGELEEEIVVRSKAEEDLMKSREELQGLMEQLKESERKYRNLFETAGDGIFLMDKDVFVDCNAKSLEMFGCSREQLIHQTPLRFSPFSQPDGKTSELKVREKIEAALHGETQFFEWLYQTYDGKPFFAEVSLNAIAVGETDLLQAIVRDITQRKELEKDLRQAQKMESIGTLAGGIAHDFNNILTAILGYAEMAVFDSGKPELLKADLAEIIHSGHRAGELVKQILTFSRKGEQELQPLQLQLIVKEALKLLRSSLPTTLSIRQQIDPDCDQVLADPSQVHQVVMNLCTNAYHAMGDGSGELEVTLRTVESAAAELPAELALGPGRYVILEVCDTGCGMTEEVRERIFEPYFTTKEKGEGTGLGLAVVHGILQSLGGVITVESEPGKGATFRIFFPVVPSPELVMKKRGEISTHPQGSERILLVDDEPVIVKLLGRGLKSLGYQPSSFTVSSEALAAFEQNPEQFDLVITDMTMPGMTGEELARRILAIRPEVPVILCTGFNQQMDAAKAEQAGISRFLQKPVNLSELFGVVREVLDSRPKKKAEGV
ncbi:MAG: transporter substrate-binding domain-containing protein [Proteobacteria bacterium]|nr:transporter substrate-binding domain-containing protein [Pseudomonadota bacterium]MBU1688582.1 transporter substrate-binding domain-containing protein [Pseudomonadota bacterium]